MKQICAQCQGTNLDMKTNGRSSSRIEQYVCRDCQIMFFAKRPTRRAKRVERELQELLDRFAGQFAVALLQTQPGSFDDFHKSALEAYAMAEIMLKARRQHCEEP